MGHGAPLVLHHGSAISGRERDLIVGYEMDAQEGMLINKEVTGAAGGSDGTLLGPPVQMRHPIHGNGLCFDGADRVNYTVAGVATHTAGTIAITVRLDDIILTRYIFRAIIGATRYYIAVSGGNLWTIFKEADAVAELTTAFFRAGRTYRILVTWNTDHAYVYFDGDLVDDYDTHGLLLDFTTADIGGIANQWLGTGHEFLQIDRQVTPAEVRRDYIQFARRAWYQESFRSAHVSSMANPSGQPLENTRWIIDETPNGGSDFRIVDAPELERLAGFAGAKAMAKLSAGGWAYLPLQYAGLHAPTPEAAYGTFDFWIRHDGNADTYAHFIADTNSPNIVSGYAIRVTNTERLQLRRFTGGGGATILRTVVDYFPVDTWTRVTVTRRYDGEFWVLINGVPIDNADIDVGTNPVTDNTHQTGSYVIAEIGEYDEFGMLSHRWGVAA
jgi:hypothetical protein